MEAWKGKIESDQNSNPVALITNPEAQCLTSGTHGRITWVSNGLVRPGPPAPWPTEHAASPMRQLQSMYAVCHNQHTVVTASPTSWGLCSNLSFIFTASSQDVLADTLHIPWPQRLPGNMVWGPLILSILHRSCLQISPARTTLLSSLLASVESGPLGPQLKQPPCALPGGKLPSSGANESQVTPSVAISGGLPPFTGKWICLFTS